MAHEPFFRDIPDSRCAVLFIHGILGSPDHFRPLLPLVPKHWTVQNLLLDGHGGSTLDFSCASMKKWQTQVLTAVNQLSAGHDRLLVVGHSMGALLAIHAMMELPSAIDQLFLLNVPLYITLKYPAIIHSCMAIFRWFPINDLPALAARDSCSIKLTRRLWQYLGWFPRYRELFSEASRLRRHIGHIDIPCRVFHSRRDALVSEASCHLLLTNPHVHLTILEHSGHYYYAPDDLSAICSAFANNCNSLTEN